MSSRAVASTAWINHYYCKSEEDYLDKMQRKSTLDTIGIKLPSRTPEKLQAEMKKFNQMVDLCALEFYRVRCERMKLPKAIADSRDAAAH